MNRKKVLILLVSFALLIGAFALIAVAVTETTGANAETEHEVAKDNTKSDTSSTSPGKEAAEGLIDETVSREKIEENVGKWKDFEMSSDGCERGVYAGKFYYEEFMIYSRTYDKGKTFHIMSVN